MKKKSYFLIICISFLLPVGVYAATPDAFTFDNFFSNFTSSANIVAIFVLMGPTFERIALNILYFLLIIQIVFELGTMALRNQMDIGGSFLVIGRALMIGILFMLIIKLPMVTWLTKWLTGTFMQLGSDLANPFGFFGTFSFGQLIVEIANLISDTIESASEQSVNIHMSIFLMQLMTTYFVVMMVGEYVMAIIKFIFMAYINLLAMAFAPFAPTRQWAINGLSSLLKVGITIVMVRVVIAIFGPFIVTYIQQYIADREVASLIYLLIFAILGNTIVSGMSGLINGVFSGQGIGNSGLGQSTMQATQPAAMNHAIASGMSKPPVPTQTAGLAASKGGSSGASGLSNGGGGNNMNNPILGGGAASTAANGAGKAAVSAAKGLGAAGGGLMGTTAMSSGSMVNGGEGAAADSSVSLPTSYKSSFE